MLNEFLKRLPADAKTEAELITTAFAIAENVKSKAADIRANAKFSAIGQAEEIKKVAMGGPLEHFKQVRQRVAGMKADIVNLRKSFVPKAPDRTDLYGQAERHKLLDRLLLMKPADALRRAVEDEAYAEAVLAHPQLSNFSRDQLDRVGQAYVERHHGPQLAGVAKREEIIAELESAMQIASYEFRTASGLSEAEMAA